MVIARNILIAFALVLLTATQTYAQVERVSQPGRYAGYSAPQYDTWVRVSQYVAVRDGTQLAVDIFRPAQNGSPAATRLPVVWEHNRYHRANVENGKLTTVLDTTPWLKTLLHYGYIVAVADVRGSGASFGTRTGELTEQDAQDAFDLTEWFAAQAWCDGNVGMFGASFMGAVQFATATLAPPHLKAIMPQVAPLNRYDDYYAGGVFQAGASAEWSRTLRELDATPAAPVDADRDGTLLQQALAQHRANADFFALAESATYRDDALWRAIDFNALSRAPVAIYHIAGWSDDYRRDAFIALENLSNPQKLLVGPWTHSRVGEYFDLGIEHVRWYDYWLKAIDNGIMREPQIYFHVAGVPEKEAWRFADRWTRRDEKPTPFYLRAGKSGSVNSVNDGTLKTDAPTDPAGFDEYTIDYTTTTGEPMRWNDERGLTYTTAPLSTSMQIVGHPILHLWISASAPDVDVFASLERVATNGASRSVSDGVLRASHRALAPAPFPLHALALPFHPSVAKSIEPLPVGQPVELVFDLLPVAQVFAPGERIRLTLTNADAGNAATPRLAPSPSVRVYREATHQSNIVLPVVPRIATSTAQTASMSLPIIGAVIAGIVVALASLVWIMRYRKV
jgi:putative CocE/NonD family hydrolase